MVETKKQQTRPAKRGDGNARKAKGKNIRVKRQAKNNPPAPPTGSTTQLEDNQAKEKKVSPEPAQEEASKNRDQAQESSEADVQNPKDYFAHIKELRETLDDYLLLSPDPILEALIDKKGDLLSAVKAWIPLYKLTQAIYEAEIKKGASIEAATKSNEEKKAQIASRILGRGSL